MSERSFPQRQGKNSLRPISIYNGVAQASAITAMKRWQNTELTAIAGLMHDLHTYRSSDPTGHAHHGAALAWQLLTPTGLFTQEEMGEVFAAIYNHSDKQGRHAPLAEILIDADVLQHTLYSPQQKPVPKEGVRFRVLCEELGLGL